MNATIQMMDETLVYIYKEIMETYVPDYIKSIQYTPWVFSLLGSALIGLAGILPLFIIPNISDSDKKNMKDRK